MLLDNKIALVTGASRGIGAAIAQALAQEGARVIGTATSEQGALAISERLAPYGGLGKRLELNEAGAIEHVVDTVTEELGTITILVNNAGITRDTLLLRMKEEDWANVIDTNLTAVFKMTKAVLRGMLKAQSGRIINISSVVGASGNPGQANYAAAKAGMIGFTKSVAREVGSRHITVNCVAPGFIETDMTQSLPSAQRDVLLGQITLGRLGEAKEVADSVVFLASDKASYITGQTLHVNGGMLMI